MKKWKLIGLTLYFLITSPLFFPATALGRNDNLKDAVIQGGVLNQKVALNGPMIDNIYISALFLVIRPQASMGKAADFSGNSIKTQAGSTISRDLNVICLESGRVR